MQRYWDGQRWTQHQAPVSAAPVGAAPQSTEVSTGVIILAAALLGAIIGAFAPWVTLGVFSKSGTEADGAITAVIAAAMAVGVLAKRGRTSGGLGGWAIACGVVITLIGFADIADVNDKVGEDFAAGVGWGLYLTVVAGIAIVVGGFRVRAEAKSPTV